MLAGHSSMSQRRNRYEQASTVDWDGRKLLASVRGPFVPWLECMKMFAVFTFVRYTSHSVLGKCHLTSCAFIGKFKSRRPQSSGSIAIWDWVVRRRSRFLLPNPISWYQPRMSRTRREKKNIVEHVETSRNFWNCLWNSWCHCWSWSFIDYLLLGAFWWTRAWLKQYLSCFDHSWSAGLDFWMCLGAKLAQLLLSWSCGAFCLRRSQRSCTFLW